MARGGLRLDSLPGGLQPARIAAAIAIGRSVIAQAWYLPYESLVAWAAAAEGLDPAVAQRLTRAYGQLRPWPEAPRVVAAIAAAMPIGTVTNCSDELGRQAAELVGVPFEVTVTAQSAGAYKPQPEPYRQALDALALSAAGDRGRRKAARLPGGIRDRPVRAC